MRYEKIYETAGLIVVLLGALSISSVFILATVTLFHFIIKNW